MEGRKEEDREREVVGGREMRELMQEKREGNDRT